jgi:hypothetical protein
MRRQPPVGIFEDCYNIVKTIALRRKPPWKRGGFLRDMDCCGRSPRLTGKIPVHPASPGYEYRF